VGAVAAVLLYGTHSTALMLAAVLAAGILFTAALASSQERLGWPQRVVVVAAVLLPLLAGAGIGAGVFGEVSEEARNINAEPPVVVPDDAPVIAAVNSSEFCLPDEDG